MLTARIERSTTAPCSITIMRDGVDYHTYDVQLITIDFPLEDIVVRLTSNAVNKTQETA